MTTIRVKLKVAANLSTRRGPAHFPVLFRCIGDGCARPDEPLALVWSG